MGRERDLERPRRSSRRRPFSTARERAGERFESSTTVASPILRHAGRRATTRFGPVSTSRCLPVLRQPRRSGSPRCSGHRSVVRDPAECATLLVRRRRLCLRLFGSPTLMLRPSPRTPHRRLWRLRRRRRDLGGGRLRDRLLRIPAIRSEQVASAPSPPDQRRRERSVDRRYRRPLSSPPSPASRRDHSTLRQRRSDSAAGRATANGSRRSSISDGSTETGPWPRVPAGHGRPTIGRLFQPLPPSPKDSQFRAPPSCTQPPTPRASRAAFSPRSRQTSAASIGG